MTKVIENESHLECARQRNALLLRVTGTTAHDPKRQVAALLAALPGLPAVLHGANMQGDTTAVFVEVYPDTVMAAGEFILRLREIGELGVLLEPGTEWAPLRSEHLFGAVAADAELQAT